MTFSRILQSALLLGLAGCAEDVDPWVAAYEPCEGLMQRAAEAHVDDLLGSKIYDRLAYERFEEVAGLGRFTEYEIPNKHRSTLVDTLVIYKEEGSFFSYLRGDGNNVPLCIRLSRAGAPISIHEIFAASAAQDIAQRHSVFSNLEQHLFIEVLVADGEFESLTLVTPQVD